MPRFVIACLALLTFILIDCTAPQTPLLVGNICELACTAPAVATGDASRVCTALANGTGVWSGTPLVCTLPPPCLAQPCIGAASVCVEDFTKVDRFRCDCVPGAFGTPGPLGEGCVIPGVVLSNGDIAHSVAANADILVTIGSQTFTTTTIAAQIEAIPAVADSKIANWTSPGFVGSEAVLNAELNANATSLTSTIASQVSTAQASVATEATSATASLVTTAAADATSRASATLSSSNSRAGAAIAAVEPVTLSAYQAADERTLSTVNANTDNVRINLASQLACM